MFAWFKSLFKKKILLYTAIGYDDYFKIVNRLAANGVKYFIRIPVDVRGHSFGTASQQNKPYDIFVREEDEGRAVEAIRNKW